MKSQVWFLCFTFGLAFVALSVSSQGRPPYIPPIEFGRKREAKHGFMVNETSSFFRKIISVYSIGTPLIRLPGEGI